MQMAENKIFIQTANIICMDKMREKAKEMGFRVVYKPHEVMKDYNATYNVIYDGKRITNPAGIKLGIPTGEIWISDKWKKYEDYILFHEIEEIIFRSKGYGIEEAHYLSEMACIKKFGKDEKWREFIVELHISDVKTMVDEIKSGKFKP